MARAGTAVSHPKLVKAEELGRASSAVRNGVLDRLLIFLQKYRNYISLSKGMSEVFIQFHLQFLNKYQAMIIICTKY